MLKVTLSVFPDFKWNDRVSGTNEPWWIWVEDPENEHIYHHEYFLLSKQQVQEYNRSIRDKKRIEKENGDFDYEEQRGEAIKLVFTIPIFEPLPTQYIVKAVSNRWLGAESTHAISFRHLILPHQYPPHTKLLDLHPLPVTALQNPNFEKLFKFSHFNPIQTQVFHCCYNTDENVLLGAPTGSGKTVAAELAILRLMKERPDLKSIYIAPLKALVSERMKDWNRKFVETLGKRLVELTGDFTPDIATLKSADIVTTTPEKWDGISRNWQQRPYVKSVGLVIIDEVHLLGMERGPILEVIVSRMRYISSRTDTPIRILCLSTAVANARDLADWIGIEGKGAGLFNFQPSVRPVPLQVHIQGYPGEHYCPRMATMNKPSYQAIRNYSPHQPVLVFVSSRRQNKTNSTRTHYLRSSRS